MNRKEYNFIIFIQLNSIIFLNQIIKIPYNSFKYYSIQIVILTQGFLILNVSKVLSIFMDCGVEGELTDNNDSISSSFFVLFTRVAEL